MYQRIFLVLIGIYFSAKFTHSKGTVEWKFIKYSNSGGTGSNGNCCDGVWFACPTPCDHYFKICLDNQSGNDNDFSNNCPFGKKQSGQTLDRNVIEFKDDIGGLANPMKFNFVNWPGGLKLKVQVVDHDNNNHDHVDDLVKNYDATPITYSKAKSDAGWTQFTMKGRTVLETKIRVYCDENYYNANCDKYCKPGNSSADGYYTCDEKTGNRVCRKGWEGQYCRTASNPCQVDPCMDYQICKRTGQLTRDCICPVGKIGQFCNETEVCTNTTCGEEGNCSMVNGSISCACSDYWTGRYCDTWIDPCNTVTCQNNGTCDSNTTGDAICICEQGWTGKLCETEYDPCMECLNNSTCISAGNGTGNITCTCLEGWTGVFCETESVYDACDECMNNSTCIRSDNQTKNVTCLCSEGWTGKYCEIKYYPCTECLNNSTCVVSSNGTGNVSCTCLVGWTGNYCETKYDPCDSMPCLNNGTCSNNGSSLHCICIDDFTGIQCERLISLTTPQSVNATNGTDTTVSITTTSSTSAAVTTPKTPPVEMTFVGLVKDDRKMASEFEKMVYELTDTKNEIKLIYKMKYLKSKEGDTLTRASFRILENDKDISDKVNSVISNTEPERLDKYFTMKLYREYEKDIKPEKLQSHEDMGWIHTYWYVVMIAILVLIVLFVLGAVLIAKYRRKKNVLPGQKDVVARQSSNISDAAPAQSFENSLYFEMNQPVKKEPKTSTSSE